MAADLEFKDGEFGKVWAGASRECLDFTRRCLRLKPQARPSARECKQESWLRAARRKRPVTASWRTTCSSPSERHSSLSSMATRRADNDERESVMDVGWELSSSKQQRSLEQRTTQVHHGGDTPATSRNSSAKSKPDWEESERMGAKGGTAHAAFEIEETPVPAHVLALRADARHGHGQWVGHGEEIEHVTEIGEEHEVFERAA
eukprot:2042928-Rhodomonas_salina.1